MLIVGRKLGEVVHVGLDITVMVVGVDLNTGQVKLGIEAPPDTGIWRKEIFKPGQAPHTTENQRAAYGRRTAFKTGDRVFSPLHESPGTVSLAGSALAEVALDKFDGKIYTVNVSQMTRLKEGA